MKKILFLAIKQHDNEKAKSLIEKGCNLSGALAIAAANNNIEMVNELIKNKVDLDEIFYNEITDDIISSPLITASMNGNVEIVKLIINAGANVNLYDWRFGTALHVGCKFNEITKLLINAGVNIDKQNFKGETPLMISVGNGYESAETLLKYGANIELRNRLGETALFKAVINCDNNVVKQLIDLGANVNDKNNKGVTVVQKLLDWILEDEDILDYKRKIQNFNTLIQAGVDVTINSDDGKQTEDFTDIEELKELVKKIRDNNETHQIFNEDSLNF